MQIDLCTCGLLRRLGWTGLDQTPELHRYMYLLIGPGRDAEMTETTVTIFGRLRFMYFWASL